MFGKMTMALVAGTMAFGSMAMAQDENAERGPRAEAMTKDRPMDRGARLDAMFDRADANGDGAISREEFRAGMEAMHQRGRPHLKDADMERRPHGDRAERREKGEKKGAPIWRERGEWNKTETGKDAPEQE